MPAGIVTPRRSPADEGEEHLLDDGGDGVHAGGQSPLSRERWCRGCARHAGDIWSSARRGWPST